MSVQWLPKSFGTDRETDNLLLYYKDIPVCNETKIDNIYIFLSMDNQKHSKNLIPEVQPQWLWDQGSSPASFYFSLGQTDNCLFLIHRYIYRWIFRQINRQIVRQIDRQKVRQIVRQIDSQIDLFLLSSEVSLKVIQIITVKTRMTTSIKAKL